MDPQFIGSINVVLIAAATHERMDHSVLTTTLLWSFTVVLIRGVGFGISCG
jgi:hypothetical protein